MHWLRRRNHLKIFLILALAAILFNVLSNFSRELAKEPSCEIISKSAIDLAEEVAKSSFLFIALATILFNGAEPFEQFW